MAKLEMGDILECEEYLSVAQAASVLGIKKAAMFYKIYERRLFPNIRRIGGGPDGSSIEGDRPILLLPKSDVYHVRPVEDPAHKLEMKDIAECEEYMTVTQAAKIFGISKSSMFYKIYEQQLFPNARRLGGGPDGTSTDGGRPIVLLLKSEVLAVKAAENEARHAVPPPPTPEQLLKDWNHRVKDWGFQWPETFGQIWANGRPTEALTAAYVKAHPEDPRPV